MTNMSTARIVFVLVASFVLSISVRAADPPLELEWAQLMPPAETAPQKRPELFFSFSDAMPPSADATTPEDATPPPPIKEGNWMSMKRRQPGGDRSPRVVAELNGKRVSISGYVVPLYFDGTSIKEFLLVPYVGACIHVPAPPVNQIVYVKTEKGLEIDQLFDPVTVIGTMKTETASTGLADVSYSIDAESVELRTE
ncbi:MAG: DUF3299 domain-containing protein [Hyphomicrobium sp.]|nr:DUF3299 domain-containing protein [Hyphomicrobium sp.]